MFQAYSFKLDQVTPEQAEKEAVVFQTDVQDPGTYTTPGFLDEHEEKPLEIAYEQNPPEPEPDTDTEKTRVIVIEKKTSNFFLYFLIAGIFLFIFFKKR